MSKFAITVALLSTVTQTLYCFHTNYRHVQCFKTAVLQIHTCFFYISRKFNKLALTPLILLVQRFREIDVARSTSRHSLATLSASFQIILPYHASTLN